MKKLFERKYHRGDENRLDLVRTDLIEPYTPYIRGIRGYFDFEASGWENLAGAPSRRIFVMNHGIFPADAVFFAIEHYQRTGQQVRILCDRLLFKVPALRRMLLSLGCVIGKPEVAHRILDEGHAVLVYPGGSREGWKSSSARHNLKWDKRFGFARIAIQRQAAVIPISSIGADDTYLILNNGVETFARMFPGRQGVMKTMPFPVFMGLGPLPFPAKMTADIGEPILPPAEVPEDRLPEEAMILQERVRETLLAMLREGEARRGRTFTDRMGRRLLSFADRLQGGLPRLKPGGARS